MAKPCVKKMLFTPTFYKKISHVDYVADWDIKQNNILFNSAAGVVAICNIVPNFGIIRYVDFCRFKLFYIFLPIKIQSLDLCNSNLAMVPKWTSSGPSAILRVLAPAQRCARTVSDDTPAPPCTWIAMSRTLSAMFGAATCSVQHQKHFLRKNLHVSYVADWNINEHNILFTLAIAMVPRAFLFPSRSSWSAASSTNNLVLSSSIRHCIHGHLQTPRALSNKQN